VREMVAGRVPWPVEWRWQQQAGGAERLAHRLRMASAQAETIRPGDWSAARGLATAQGMRDCKASPHAVPKPAESRRGGTTEVSARRHAGAGCSHPRSVLPPLARPALGFARLGDYARGRLGLSVRELHALARVAVRPARPARCRRRVSATVSWRAPRRPARAPRPAPAPGARGRRTTRRRSYTRPRCPTAGPRTSRSPSRP